MDDELKSELDRHIVQLLLRYKRTVEIIVTGAKTGGTSRAVLIREDL